MLSLQSRKEKIIHNLRKRHIEEIQHNIRQQLLSQLEYQQQPLLSNTLEIFWQLSHFQLCHTSQKIIEVLYNTKFEELEDEEHYYLVTDIFYLVHEHIISEPFFARFKKNQDPNTASLVAYLASEIQPQQLIYWTHFMDQESKNLMFSTIEVQSEQHKKWVQHPKLFEILLSQLKYSCEAADAFRSILFNSEELSKKQIDQSILCLHKAIIYASDQEKEQLRWLLISSWLRIILIYQKIKENSSKIQFMIIALTNELPKKLELFLSLDILSDLNQLYQNMLFDYLGSDLSLQQLAKYVLYKLTNHPDHIEGNDTQYYLNSLFRLFYNNWRARHVSDKIYSYTPQLMYTLQELSRWSGENVWHMKLRSCVN